MSRSSMSPYSQMLLDYLRKNGETSAANLGRLICESMLGNSNPGTLAASSVLRSLERRGLVRRRISTGRKHNRTMWRISDSANTGAQATTPAGTQTTKET